MTHFFNILAFYATHPTLFWNSLFTKPKADRELTQQEKDHIEHLKDTL